LREIKALTGFNEDSLLLPVDDREVFEDVLAVFLFDKIFCLRDIDFVFDILTLFKFLTVRGLLDNPFVLY